MKTAAYALRAIVGLALGLGGLVAAVSGFYGFPLVGLGLADLTSTLARLLGGLLALALAFFIVNAGERR